MSKSQTLANPIYENKILSTTISIKPNELNTINMPEIILSNLKNRVEGKCMSDGYVKPDSIVIISRSLGAMENRDFTGGISYFIKYSALLCSPKEGQVIECIIDTYDDTNCVCYVGDEATSPVEIYLFRDHYIGNPEYANLKKGNKILVKVLEVHIDFGTPKVLVTALYLNRV